LGDFLFTKVENAFTLKLEPAPKCYLLADEQMLLCGRVFGGRQVSFD
jgi:hypothetical protein